MRLAPRHRGFGLIVALITLGVAAALLATVTVQIAGLVDRSSRFAREQRARALAEAGIEAALALRDTPRAFDFLENSGAALARSRRSSPSFDFSLGGGRCVAKFTPEAALPGPDASARFAIVSEGTLPSAGGETVCRVVLALRVDSANTLHVERRDESVKYVRRPALPAK